MLEAERLVLRGREGAGGEMGGNEEEEEEEEPRCARARSLPNSSRTENMCLLRRGSLGP
jgi:hypothetical protein